MQATGDADPREALRRTMVDRQIRTFDVTDSAVLSRMLEVPRERFLPEALDPLAYSDSMIHLSGDDGVSRAMLPPLVLARLLQGAQISPQDKVLVVAAGTGYSTALVAGLAREVVAVEADDALFAELRANLDAAGLQTARALNVPMTAGAPAEAPFDVIVIDGGVAANLDPLLGQLRSGGRLVAVQQMDDGSSKAVRYDSTNGVTGRRLLFDASAPLLDAFRPAEAFTFG